MTRDWQVLGYYDDDDTFVYDRDDMAQALLEVETILFRLGGAVTIGSITEQVGDRYVRRGLALKWHSFVPTIGEPKKPQPVADVVPGLDPNGDTVYEDELEPAA